MAASVQKVYFCQFVVKKQVEIFFQLTGLTGSNISFYMTKILSKSYSLI